jgi:hypothetical protein
MRNLLAFLAALTLTVLGVGWYLDWYHVRTNPSSQGKKSVTVDINTRKISEDIQKAEQQLQRRLAERSGNALKNQPTSRLEPPTPGRTEFPLPIQRQ